jgi:HD-like signal output (HDOD) protein
MGLLDAIKRAKEQKNPDLAAVSPAGIQAIPPAGAHDMAEQGALHSQALPGIEDLNKILDSIQDVPTLPSIANKVIQAINDPQSNAKVIADIIKYDPALTARLLKVGNSAYYAGYSPCASVQNAITRMGLLQIRRLVFSISILDAFDKYAASGFNIKDFWKHSIAVAYNTRTIGRIACFRDTEELFTAGLLHDLGMLIIIKYMPEMFDAIMKKIEENPEISFYQYERADFPISHCEIGSWLSVRWQMSREIQSVIFSHHQPPINSTLFEKDVIMFSAVVYLADKFSARIEAGFLNDSAGDIDKDIFNFVFGEKVTEEEVLAHLLKNKSIIEATAASL